MWAEHSAASVGELRVSEPSPTRPHGSGRVAVVGTGSIGMRHLDVLRGIEGPPPVAIPIRAERRHHVEAEGYATAKDLAQAGPLGVTRCIVATDTSRHVEDGLEALERGLDVLVEKPLAVNASEARRLCARAAALRRRLFVGCVLRFSESLNTFRNLLAEVGRVHAVRIECQSYLPDWRPARPYQTSYSARAADGGVLRDLIHEIDYAGWLFGWPSALEARLRNLGRLGIQAEEIAELSWELATGGVLSMTLDYLTRPPRRWMRACGKRGTLEWDGITGTVTWSLAGAPVSVRRSSQSRNEMFAVQARAFLKADDSACDPRLATGEDGVKALAVCDAARRASERAAPEQVHAL